MTDVNIVLKAAAFAAEKHRDQVRKGRISRPYINHPIEVAELISTVGDVHDVDILAAAILHDTVEDTGTSPDELLSLFGRRVHDYVLEVSDDKNLPKAVRKRLQIEHAPHKSQGAKIVKLADKASNVGEIAANPPSDWDVSRQMQYLQWAEEVVAGLRGANPKLEEFFDQTMTDARVTLSIRGD